MSTGLEWDEHYRLGITSIDDQHKHLFDIVAHIAALDAATSTKEDLRQILGELSTYMSEHFKDEEKYMEQIRFPSYEYHMRLHHDIIEFVNSSVSQAPTLAMIQTKLKFIIKKALIDHILVEDMKIKLFMMQKKEIMEEGIIDLESV
ncbi:hemerythrin family protein [Sulfuricurvum sp.]|uniref:bacteriohemerythrin n=1 Tax=Sulfuricurvum sp. TaxID=2025608 RepID=UPI00261DEE43|nr:hemerythrin family protein [Sulfuricurvum sp.]